MLVKEICGSLILIYNKGCIFIHIYIQKMPGSLKIAKIMSIYQMVRQNDTAKNRLGSQSQVSAEILENLSQDLIS